MSEMTKKIGTSVISTIGIALGITAERFGELLKIAQEVINYQPVENEDQEKMAAEWNLCIRQATAGLVAHEAVLVGTIVALYLHEGILEQNEEDGSDFVDEDEDSTSYTATGAEGWLTDTYRDVV